MKHDVKVLIGTGKGAFFADRNGAGWTLSGPFCDAWNINHVIGDARTGTVWAAGGNPFLGIGVWKTTDGGGTWTWSGEGLSLGDDEKLQTIWSLARGPDGRLWAGAKPAGLFVSEDDGVTWRHKAGLRNHSSRDKWMPGGAGLILHHILVDPEDGNRLWVGISTAGVFASEDGGESWEPRNRGTRADFMPEGQRLPEVGQCVHGIALAPGPGRRLYQQSHTGMYRSDDDGRHWESIEAGLPSSFGFPTAAHPRDRDTVWLIPLNGDMAGRYVPDGAAAVWRSRDAGESWQDLRTGLPQSHVYFAVLRQALAVDRHEPAGVFFGTNSGILYASADEGDTWEEALRHLRMIASVEVLAV